MKLTLLYQTFYKNIDFTRSNIGDKKLGIATRNIQVIYVMNVPSLIKLIIVAGDGMMLNGGGFTKQMFALYCHLYALQSLINPLAALDYLTHHQNKKALTSTLQISIRHLLHPRFCCSCY